MIGIYKIENKINGKIYIGQSNNIKRRLYEHKTRDQLPVEKAIQKYGVDSFTFEVIEECPIEKLDEKEEYWISYYNSYGKNGYNCNEGGGSFSGENHYRAKMTVEEVAEVNGEESSDTEIAVDISADAEPAVTLTDQVRSWVVANGQTLREVLQDWCNKEGWDLVWATSREYPIEASAVFKGRFVDVASALVRNFARATPVPYAKFYKGNRVLVISTSE